MSSFWLLGFTPMLLAVTAVAVTRGGGGCRSYWLAWCGLAATMAGDYFLAVKGAPLDSDGFLFGVAGFSLAHGFWIAFLMRHAALNARVAFGLLLALGVLFAARVMPALPSGRLAWALGGYLLLSVASVSYACGPHRLSAAWRYGLCALLFSDVMIAFGQVLRVPHTRPWAGAAYLASLAFIAAAIARCGRCPRLAAAPLRQLRRAPYAILFGGMATFLCFLAAGLLYPGKAYNPFMQMLSVLGRTRLEGVDHPACHYFFTAGLALSALAVACFCPALAYFVKHARGRVWVRWGGAVTASGLLIIACVPENVHGFYHNVGCFTAGIGGGMVFIPLTSGRTNPRVSAAVRWGWLAGCALLAAVFTGFMACHRARVLPFAPYVPTCQKLLILAFVVWLGDYAARLRRAVGRPPCHSRVKNGMLTP